jgi:hypothetical protein
MKQPAVLHDNGLAGAQIITTVRPLPVAKNDAGVAGLEPPKGHRAAVGIGGGFGQGGSERHGWDSF